MPRRYRGPRPKTRKLHIFISNFRFLNSLREVTGDENAKMDITKLDEYLQNQDWTRTNSRVRDRNVVVTRVVTGLKNSRRSQYIHNLYEELGYTRVYHSRDETAEVEALIEEAYEVVLNEEQLAQWERSSLIFVVGTCSSPRYGYRSEDDDDPFLSDDMYSRFEEMSNFGYDIEVVGWGENWWDQSSISSVYSIDELFENLGMRYHSLSDDISDLCLQNNAQRGVRGGGGAYSSSEDSRDYSGGGAIVPMSVFNGIVFQNASQQSSQVQQLSQGQQPPQGQQDSNVAGGAAVVKSTTSSSTPLNDPMICIICFDKPRNMILLPCGHVIMCTDCHGRLNASSSNTRMKCPKCRKDVLATSLAYF